MSLIIAAADLAQRRAVASGPLASLAAGLAADLAPLRDKPLFVPEQKALLSREGGRCPRDGAMLDFDPYSPHAHRCPICGRTWEGELHDRFWIYWYQLWLAERAVWAATLAATGRSELARLSVEILERYADLYPRYPNVDNALGPTRVFFSTYLESIWLLQVCLAADLLGPALPAAVRDRFRDRLVEPSAALIASYDEGLSNRQVWNNAALIAAYRLLGRDDAAESVIWAGSGLVRHLSNGMLADGTWYEGENYHLFAHRGLWYGMQLAAQLGAELPADLVARFDAGFRTPLLTALPDLTFPSRRDSQYAVSLRQWRFAEMCELGLARGDDRVVRGMLARLYAPDIGRGDTGRWKATAEAERNLPPARLDRADLGWKSLLFAQPSLDVEGAPPLPSVLLAGQGIGVLRRDHARVYAALDYGVSGGGHGHPDRLNVLLMNGGDRLLDDYGTGSYVDPSLHWYRSTLAHNAPMFDGVSQPRVDGSLEAYEDRGGAGWIVASARFGNHQVRRTLVAMPDYAVDEIQWHGGSARWFDLPLHVDAELVEPAVKFAEQWLAGGKGLEDGFRYVTSAERATSTGDTSHSLRLAAKVGQTAVDVWLASDAPFELWRLRAPGPPTRGAATFLMVRSRADAGAIRIVWSWEGAVQSARLFPAIVVSCANGASHTHARVAHGWNIGIQVAGARSSIDLEGLAPPEPPAIPASRGSGGVEPVTLPTGAAAVFDLGKGAYRRTEESWDDAGQPGARIEIAHVDRRLSIDIVVSNVDPSFVPAGATNRLDNEAADVNGAGVQLYLRVGSATAGYMLVPEAGSSAVRHRAIDGWGPSPSAESHAAGSTVAADAQIPVAATWRATRDGYLVHVDVDVPGEEPVLCLDIVVNEKPAGRERRRGQLVLSGGAGEFAYLRGDRHDPTRLIPFLLTNA